MLTHIVPSPGSVIPNHRSPILASNIIELLVVGPGMSSDPKCWCVVVVDRPGLKKGGAAFGSDMFGQ